LALVLGLRLVPEKMHPATTALAPGAAHTATDSVGDATAGDAHTLTAAAHGAFTVAIGVALLIGTVVMLAAALRVKRYVPDLRTASTDARQ
jgi:hypothetical protein